MPPSTLCSAKASYKKLPGLLQLTASHLQWTQDGKKAPSVRVAHVDAACKPSRHLRVQHSNNHSCILALFSSKEGAAQVRLKIGLVGDDTGHNFTFTSPQPVALTEREAFKRELTTIIGRNRSIQDVATPQAPASASVIPSAVSLSRPKLFPSSHPSSSRAASVSSDARTPGTPINDPIHDFRLRKKVLVNNPELAALHRELVITGQITEAEFWDGREVMPFALSYIVVQSFMHPLFYISIFFSLKQRRSLRNEGGLVS